MSEKADLERLTVLVVEDNRFICEMLSDVLRSVGIGKVVTAIDGNDAIDFLRTVSVDPMKAGISIVDAVISDIFMPSVDGRMLLRWVRTSADSPDRFIPFLAISGAADREIVQEFRDLGMSEFLAKPFSATSVAQKFMHVIMHPRNFILAPNYFGPERRRTEQFLDNERRKTKDSEIQIVHSEEPPKKIREDAKVLKFQFRNRLADKIGAYALKGIPEIDPELIKQAEAKIADMAGDYSEWVATSIRELSQSLAQLREGEGDSKALMSTMNTLAHEFRGQGGIFGYPLVTQFGKSLYEATQNPELNVTAHHIDYFKAHVDAINAVMNEKIKGDGGEIGTALLAGLKEAQKQFAQKSETVE